MRILCQILVIFILNMSLVIAKETLFDSPIDLIHKKECSLDEFCKEFIEDIDIEKFIRKEIEADYVLVSLDKCLDIAMKNNFNIQIADKEYFYSKYEFDYSLSKFLPMLSTTSYIADYSGQILVGGVLRDKFHETAISVNMTAQHDLTQGGRTIFEAKAAKPRNISVKLGGDDDNNWAVYSEIYTPSLSTDYQKYEYTFIMQRKSDAQARLEFNLGTNATDVWIKNVKLTAE